VVDNFDIFPVSIYTPLYDKRSRSNDRWKLGGDAENFQFSGQINANWHIRRWVFIPAETEETQNTKVVGELPDLTKKGKNSRFWYRMKKF
jgi:hypothetical protein